MLDLSNVMNIVYLFFVFITTTCIGSFLNVVVYRLPNHMNLANPPSHCPNCDHLLKWYDNIPIFSWISLGGKCRYCKAPITPRYLIVELLTGIISSLIFIRFGISFTSLFGIIIFLCLIPITFIDIEHFIIPDIFIIILAVVGILGIFFNDLNYGIGELNINWLSRLIAVGGVVVFMFIILLFEKLLKRELMGGGDIKLLAVAGLILGWQLLILVVGISSISACIIETIFKIIYDKKHLEEAKEEAPKDSEETQEEQETTAEPPAEPSINDNPELIVERMIAVEELKDVLPEEEYTPENNRKKGLFPFGPYLAAAIMICYCFGVNIIEWWLGLLKF